MVQRESVEEEEDVEHFEDVIEGDDIDPNKKAENDENDVEVDHDGGEKTSRDGDSSSDEEEALAVRQSDEEDDYASDDSEELIRNETPQLQETMEVSNDMEKRSQPLVKSSSLPGGYDPRHREPSYWSVNLIFHQKLKYTAFIPIKSDKLCLEVGTTIVF